MRHIIYTLLLLTLGAQASGVRLEWEYPEYLRTEDITFRIYTSTDLTNWSVLTNVPSTTLTVDVPMEPAKRFFRATAVSAFWGEESPPSNAKGTPDPAVPPTLAIRRML